MTQFFKEGLINKAESEKELPENGHIHSLITLVLFIYFQSLLPESHYLLRESLNEILLRLSTHHLGCLGCSSLLKVSLHALGNQLLLLSPLQEIFIEMSVNRLVSLHHLRLHLDLWFEGVSHGIDSTLWCRALLLGLIV